MKFITFLFTVFFWFNAVAVAPYGFKGQQQSQTLYSNVLQGQNNLVTNMGGINALLETGNKNILTNPSFEHATFSTGWTNSAGTFTQDTSVEIDGLKAASLVLSSQSMALHQDSTLYASQFADGVQGLASVRVKTSVAGIRVCSRQNAVVTSNLCVNVQANGKWGLYKVPFILGATSNGISINSNGTSVTGTVYVDDAFVGAVDLQADTSNISDWQDFTMTIGAVTTAPTKGATSVDKAQWRRVGSDMEIRYDYKQTGAGSAGSGIYLFPIPSGYSIDYTRVPSGSADQATSGIVKLSATADSAGATTALGQVLISKTYPNKLYLNYTQSTVENTANVSSVAYQLSGATIGYSYVAKVPIVGWGASGSVYSSTNADTDWASCGHTAASFTGFGTVTGIETQCKRQGSDLLMRGKFTSGTVTAAEARVSLPVWNGVQLTSAGNSKIQSLQIIGSSARSNVGAANTIFAAIQPSVSYSVFTAIGSPAGTTTLLGTSFGSSETQTMETLRIPIEGWQQSNIIIGQFNGLESCTSTLECTDTFSAKISSAGVVSGKNVDWLDGNCSNPTTGTYNCTIKTGIFTVIPNCTATAEGGVGSPNTAILNITSVTALSAFLRNTSNGVQSSVWNLICQKQGVDYVGKTAKAVASDQNMSVPGSVKSKMCSAELSTGNVISNQYGGCFSSSSGTTTKIILFNALTWGQIPNCWCNFKGGGATVGSSCIAYSESTSQFTIKTFNNNALLNEVSGIFCMGVSP